MFTINLAQSHVYLDTVILLGVASTQYSENTLFCSRRNYREFHIFLFAWLWSQIIVKLF